MFYQVSNIYTDEVSNRLPKISLQDYYQKTLTTVEFDA